MQFPIAIPDHPFTRASFLQRAGVRLAPLIITLLLKTLRIRVLVRPSETCERCIVAFWHGEMLVPWYLFRDRGASALVSASADGEVLARILQQWGFDVVRGSSSAGGGDAVKAMVARATAGHAVLITPDGPRGPAHAMKIGALVVAQRAGLPLVLCSVRYRAKKILHSWDSFEIPLPFSLADVSFSEPIEIPSGCAGEALDAMRVELERKLILLGGNA